MKGNTDKCHLIISSNYSSGIKIGNSLIKRSNCEKLLGVKIDTKLTFADYINNLYIKSNSKLGPQERVTPYMGLAKKKLLMNCVFAAQFNYFPLIWTFHSRRNNNKITYSRERCFRLIYNDKPSHLMKNYWKEMAQYLLITKLFKLLQLRCLKI